jgi:hypothetical protein
MSRSASPKGPALGHALAAVFLVALGAAMCGASLTLLHYAQAGDPQRKVLLTRLAAAGFVGLGIVLVLLGWVVSRIFRRALLAEPPARPTEHVDAWSLAGQRLTGNPDAPEVGIDIRDEEEDDDADDD